MLEKNVFSPEEEGQTCPCGAAAAEGSGMCADCQGEEGTPEAEE